jgi:hypothetical protein
MGGLIHHAPSWCRKQLIKASPIPYTILRSTQFFPFVIGHRPGRR